MIIGSGTAGPGGIEVWKFMNLTITIASGTGEVRTSGRGRASPPMDHLASSTVGRDAVELMDSRRSTSGLSIRLPLGDLPTSEEFSSRIP